MSVEEVEQLRKKIAELEEKVKQYVQNDYGLYCDDMYEYLVIARSVAMKDKLEDALSCTADFYRKVSDKDQIMKHVLNFFEGRTSREKKDKLRDFLNHNPHYRTKHPQLLLQRLRLKQKFEDKFAQREIPEHPIQDAIDELNTPVEESQEASKDEDFLE